MDTTPKSGDFGADVLAKDGERRVCVQCKRYAPGHPVGVKAVQEIYSAKAYYGCDDAYLYTTSEFTKAAMEMANELGVVLVRSQISAAGADCPDADPRARPLAPDVPG